MYDPFYIALGEKYAKGVDALDDGNLNTGIFTQQQGMISRAGEKPLDVFTVDLSDPSSSNFIEFRRKILETTRSDRGSFENNPIAVNMLNLLERLKNPDDRTFLFAADRKRTEELKRIFENSLEIRKIYPAVHGRPDLNLVAVKFDSPPTDEQRQQLIKYINFVEEHLPKREGNPHQITNELGTNYFNLYLFAIDNRHPDLSFETSAMQRLRRNLRPFVPQLQLHALGGVGNGQMITQQQGTTGTQTYALTEERWCPCPEPSYSDSGGGLYIDGPNQYPAYIGAAIALLGVYPGLPAESLTMKSSPSYAGVQLYLFIESGFLTMPFEGKTMGAFELVAGPGLRTNLLEVANNSHGSFVFLPGVELGGGLSSLFTTGENGNTLFGRLIAFGWYGVSRYLNNTELLVQLSRHDWGNSEMNNLLPSLAWTDNHESAWVLVRFSWESKPLEIPEPRPEPKPTPPPAPCVDPEPVHVIKGLVINLPDINFVTNEPTAEQGAALSRHAHEYQTARNSTPWTMAQLSTIVGESIFEPKQFNLVALEKIAGRLNEADLINYKIRIIGHTDGRGEGEFNMGLSLRRAQTVKDVLVLLGVNEKRLIVENKGETEPKMEENFDPSSPDQKRAQGVNRRIEFVVAEKM